MKMTIEVKMRANASVAAHHRCLIRLRKPWNKTTGCINVTFGEFRYVFAAYFLLYRPLSMKCAFIRRCGVSAQWCWDVDGYRFKSPSEELPTQRAVFSSVSAPASASRVWVTAPVSRPLYETVIRPSEGIFSHKKAEREGSVAVTWERIEPTTLPLDTSQGNIADIFL